MRAIIILSLFIGIFILGSCGSDPIDSCNGNYDQKTLFINVADNLIIPSMNNFKTSINELDAKVDIFINEPTLDNLNNVRSIFRSTYQNWQKVEYFNFGPSEAIQLNSKINNFPVNVALLEANISFGEYSLDAPDNYYSGLPSMDYLLYGIGEDDTAILNKFTADSNAQNYLDYLSGVSELMKNKFNTVEAEWTNNYRDEFVNNTGTADGSSIGLILNSLNENFEVTKRERIGIPSGYHDLAVPSFPEKIEAFYSGLSLDLLKINMQAAKDYFNGLDGEGIDDYLHFAEAQKENINLEDAINQQFDAIINNINSIPETLSESIINSPNLVQEAYVPLANQVVYLKTDTPSALCVSITYIDNASDSD